MNKLRCTWCNNEMDELEPILRHNGDPFCSNPCLDLQLADDALFEVMEALKSERG